MKKIFFIISASLMLSSCVTGTKNLSDPMSMSPEHYTISPEDKTSSHSNKFWFLFIPIGGKSPEKREAQCYNRMIKQNGSDGLLSQKYVHKKITIPLIVFTYSFKYTELKARPFKIKTDSIK